MTLLIFDANNNFVDMVNEYESFTWTEQYQGKGTFELHCVDSEKNISTIRQDYFIWMEGKRTAMLICYVEYNEKDKKIIAKGYTTLHLLTKRIVFPVHNVSIAENAMYDMVMEMFNPTEDEKYLTQFIHELTLRDLEYEYRNMLMLAQRIFELDFSGTDISVYVLELTDVILPTLNSYIKRMNISYVPSTGIITATETIGTETTEHVITEDNLILNELISEEYKRRISFHKKQFALLSDEGRRISNITTLKLTNESMGFEEEYFTQISKVNVLEAETILATETGLGFFMEFDRENKRNIFTVYKGTDRTFENGKVESIMFSADFGDQQNVIIIDDMSIFKNVAYVAGDKDFMFEKRVDFNDNIMYRKHVLVGTAIGSDRHETYVEANDIQQIFVDEYGSEIVLTDDEYEEKLRSAGIDALNELVHVESFYGEVDPSDFGIKYYLGDIVSCKSDKYGVRMDAKITEYTEVYEKNMKILTLTFGEPKISFMKGLRLWL